MLVSGSSYLPDAIPVTQPTVWEHCRIIRVCDNVTRMRFWYQSLRADERGLCNPATKVTGRLKWSKAVLENPRQLGVSCPWNVIPSPSVLWHCLLGDRKGIRPVKSWVFVCVCVCVCVGGDNLTGALHILYPQLWPPSPSSLAPVNSRMEMFWYHLTWVVPERAVNECE